MKISFLGYRKRRRGIKEKITRQNRLSTKTIEIEFLQFFSRVPLRRNEKMRFDPCEKPKDGLTEWIVTRLATIVVV
jgi:hypothetical protein